MKPLVQEPLVAFILGVATCALLVALYAVLSRAMDWPPELWDVVALGLSLLAGGKFIAGMNARVSSRLWIGGLYAVTAVGSSVFLLLYIVCYGFGHCL